jgi:transposase
VPDPDRERQLQTELEALRAENAQQADEIERLSRKITELEQRLSQGSTNSSLPPSSDSPKQQAEATKTRADRRAEAKAKRKGDVERRRGKQPGAPGKNLEMKAAPDKVVTHEPTTCSSCGEDLSGADEEGIERRQVFDTPDPIILSTEHRSVKKRCTCGKLNAGAFPKEFPCPLAGTSRGRENRVGQPRDAVVFLAFEAVKEFGAGARP